MSLEFTEKFQHWFRCTYWPGVYTILSCTQTVVADQSAISRRSVGERSATDWRSVGDWLATVSWAFVFDCRKSATFLDRLATDRRLVGDQSATKNCVGIVYNRCNWSPISRQPVGDQSATCRRPPKTFLRSIWSQRGFTCSNQNLLATKSSLQPSATGRRPVADFLATTLQPPCYHPKFWSQGGRRPVASYVWPGLYIRNALRKESNALPNISNTLLTLGNALHKICNALS